MAFTPKTPKLTRTRCADEKLTFAQVIRDNLRVMDLEAITQCREAKLPILVFNFKQDGNIERAIAGHVLGTLVAETV